MSDTLCQLSSSDPCLVGDPVDTSKGAAVDQALDFRLTGPLELRWMRHYDSSQSHRRFANGWGHTHDFDRTLQFDNDGISYHAPLGRAVSFPPLLSDGERSTRDGYVLRRISLLRYELTHYAQPAMEFEFYVATKPARLKRLFQGTAEICFMYNVEEWIRIVDSAGRVIHVEEIDGQIKSLTFENAGSHSTTPLLTYQYDERGNLISTQDLSGHGFSYTYDAENRVTRRVGRKGFSFYFSYDATGKCIQSAGDNRMYEVNLDYDIPERITTVTRADGGVWTYIFDETGKLARMHDPLGGTSEFIQDDAGLTTEEVDANGNITRMVYNAADALVAKITPLNRRIAVPEDPNTPVLRGHRVAKNPAEYEYGRLLNTNQITIPTIREARALPIPSRAQPLVVTRPVYKPMEDAEISFQPRPLGPIWWPEPKQGRVFSKWGKLLCQEDEWERKRHWDYDASGNVIAYTDFDESKWYIDRGNWHAVLAETNPLGASVRFSYHPSGELATCTDANGISSEYIYNLKDHLIEIKRQGELRDRYSRDPSGNLIAKHAGDGCLLLQFEIGPGNLPLKRILSSGDEHTFEYDDAGRRLLAASKRDKIEFAYDIVGNCSLEKRNGLGVEHRFRSRHAPKESVFFDCFTVTIKRQTNGSLVLRDPGDKEHHITLLPHGIIDRQFSNGSREWSQYDAQGRCLFKYVQYNKASLIWSRKFHWSGEGELRVVQDNLYGEIRHEYDKAHRLCKRSLPDGRVEQYELDISDNLLRQPGLDETVFQGNRLIAAHGLSFTYNNRNHVATRETRDGVLRYTYDSRDLLIRIETPAGLWQAEYDALGRRTRKIWAGQTTEFYWNADHLIGEVQANGRLRLYVYIDLLAVTPMMFLEYESIDADPASCKRYFIYSDQIGTPCLIEDESGTEVWRALISPYGSVQVAAGAKIDFNFRFPGHYFDSELGLHYNRCRYYDPVLGRYLQSDPWGIAGGYNLYAYRSNPLLKADVRGLGEEDDPKCNPPEADEESAAKPGAAQAEEGLPPLTREEGQKIVDDIHGAQPEKAQNNSVTTLSETENGTLIITNSDGLRREVRAAVENMQQPGGPLEGRDVRCNDNNRGHDDYIPPADRPLPNAPNPDRATDGEQRGVQANNVYNERGDDNGPVTRQWSSGGASHGGAACQDCETVQRQNGITNETGYQSQGGRYDRGGTEPDWNGVADPNYQPPEN